jgi:alpha-ketoglutarate-dependent taurine dioxygenase
MQAATAAPHRLSIRPLSAHIGAAIDDRIEDIVASPALSAAVVEALDRHLMLHLHAPEAAPEVMAKFSALFGPLNDGPGVCAGGIKGLRIVANYLDAAGNPLPGGADTYTQIWHTDGSAEMKPPARVVTYTERAAPSRPTTAWINMFKVYESLPDSMKRRIAGLSAIHYALKGGVDPATLSMVLPLEQRQKGPQRPLVCRHPANGKVYLHIPHRLDSVIPGLGETESRALLEELWTHVEASPYRLTETTDSGSCVVMDNCAVVHNRQGWPVTEPRTVWAITCAGPSPVGAGVA